MSNSWERICEGVYVYKKKDGTCSYRIQYNDKITNRAKHVAITPKEGLSGRELILWLSKERANLLDDISHKVYSEDSKITFDAYYTKMHPQMEVNHKPGTVKWYDQMYRLYVKDWLGDVKLQDINRQLLLKYQAYLQKRGLGDSARDGSHRMISTVLTNAVYDGVIPLNPARAQGIRPTLRKKPVKALRIEEVFDYLDKVDDYESLYWKCATYLAAFTFCRRGEVCALTWDDVDFNTNKIFIHHSACKIPGHDVMVVSTKTRNSDRLVPMADTLRKLLLEFRDQSGGYGGYLFKQRNNPQLPLSPDSLTSHMDEFCKKYHLKLVTPQILRHSGPSILRRAGVDAITSKEILGHTDLRTTTRYYIADDDQDKEDAIGKFDDLLQEQRSKRGRKSPCKAPGTD